MINNDTLIISMASCKDRINSVHVSWMSILNQLPIDSNVHCLLCLSSEEFPNKIQDLPNTLIPLVIGNEPMIELLWDDGDIKEYKKSIPCLQKYPNNKILVINDGLLYNKGWFDQFVFGNNIFPNDILCCNICKNVIIKDDYIYESEIKYDNTPRVQISLFGKPSYSSDGVLYPANTFTDKRFFDRDLFMKTCPMSDDIWQYAFSVINNKNIRHLNGFKKTSWLYKYDQLNSFNKKNFDENKIHNDISNIIPEYKDALKKRKNKFIVSLQSDCSRLKNIKPVLESIVNQDFKAEKIILNIKETDFKYINKNTLEYINQNNIEIFFVPNDICNHNKYFYSIKRFSDYAIIVLEDNVIYNKEFTSNLISDYLLDPSNIYISYSKQVTFNDKNELLPYSEWIDNYNEESKNAFFTMDYGILLPPNVFGETLEDEIVQNSPYEEDVVFNFLIKLFNIHVSIVTPSGLSFVGNYNKDKKSQNFYNSIKLNQMY